MNRREPRSSEGRRRPKGYRTIQVEGVLYLWKLHSTYERFWETYLSGVRTGLVQIMSFEPRGKNSVKILLKWDWKDSITPGDVADLIKIAHGAGWKPGGPKPFRMVEQIQANTLCSPRRILERDLRVVAEVMES